MEKGVRPAHAPGTIHRTGAGMSGMHGYLRGGILALAASIGLTVPALAQDAAAQLAVGKDAWSRASCQDCHGNMAQGGQGGDSPIGPSLRNIKYDKATMVET